MCSLFLHLEVHALNRSLSCIQALTRFVLPILDLICDATGWKATLLTGGPEPAHGGRLNMIGYVVSLPMRVLQSFDVL